jgi:hypothetical protein
MSGSAVYGLLAEFTAPEAVLEATRRARQAGYSALDAFTPYPVEGLAAELGLRRNRIPFVVLVSGLVGASVGFFMQYWAMAVDYPFNSGGRPFNSWPVFIPITFEVMVLLASLGAFFGTLFLNGLPRLHHPLFNVPAFGRATQDRFFLCIEAADPLFDLDRTRHFLAELMPVSLVLVPNEAPLPGPSPVRPPAPARLQEQELSCPSAER